MTARVRKHGLRWGAVLSDTDMVMVGLFGEWTDALQWLYFVWPIAVEYQQALEKEVTCQTSH